MIYRYLGKPGAEAARNTFYRTYRFRIEKVTRRDYTEQNMVKVVKMENSSTSTNRVSTERWIYLDVAKIISIFLIVLLHVTAGAWGELQIGSFSWYVATFFNGLSRFGFPLFFMQIGALFLNPEREMTIKKLYSKYILRLVTAFLFWSVIGMLIRYWQELPGGFSEFTLGGFISGVLSGASAVHWFIFVAISMYLIIPILRAIAKSPTACRYFLILWFVFTFAVPLLRQMSYFFPSMPDGFHVVLGQILGVADQVTPQMVLQYSGYLLLGHYIHVTKFSRNASTRFAWIFLVGLVSTIGFTILFSMRDGVSSETFFGPFTVTVLAMAAGFMGSAKYLLEKTWFKDSLYKFIRFFSSAAFGIFLVHDVLRLQLVRLGLHTTAFPPILSIPVLTIVVFVASAFIAYFLKKIPKVGKYIV